MLYPIKEAVTLVLQKDRFNHLKSYGLGMVTPPEFFL